MNGAVTSYANVLLTLAKTSADVADAQTTFQNCPQLTDALSNPTIPEAEKFAVIDRIFPASLRTFLKVVCDHEKMTIAEQIFAAYEELQNQAAGVKTVYLRYTALPSEEQKKGMESFLCRKYGAKRAYIEMKKDDSLIGGFILRVGNDEYDRSTKGRLDRLEQRLTRR